MHFTLHQNFFLDNLQTFSVTNKVSGSLIEEIFVLTSFIHFRFSVLCFSSFNDEIHVGIKDNLPGLFLFCFVDLINLLVTCFRVI